MEASSLLLLGLAAALALLFIKILSAPLRWAVKLLLHALLGFAALFLLNFFGVDWGITVELNMLNALIAGVLGIPGVILLILLRFLG